MNSVLGILVALIMAFSSIGGTPVQTEGPVSFDAKISLDAQSLLNLAGAGASVPEETEKTITVVSDILDALTVNLLVADATRTEKTICLAVSPSLKAYGIPGRIRLFDVIRKIKEVNAQRLRDAIRLGKAVPLADGSYGFSGVSANARELAADPSLEL